MIALKKSTGPGYPAETSDLPLARDAVTESIDAISCDAAVFKDALGYFAVYGLQGCECIALHLTASTASSQEQRDTQVLS